MYVCICNGFRDHELRALARQGVRDVEAAYDVLGGEPQCGRCLCIAQRVIDEEHGTAGEGEAGGFAPSPIPAAC